MYIYIYSLYKPNLWNDNRVLKKMCLQPKCAIFFFAYVFYFRSFYQLNWQKKYNIAFIVIQHNLFYSQCWLLLATDFV